VFLPLIHSHFDVTRIRSFKKFNLDKLFLGSTSSVSFVYKNPKTFSLMVDAEVVSEMLGFYPQWTWLVA
jgi:hypothetical protein